MLINQLKKNDIRYIKGVGERKSSLFHKLNIFSLYDLLNFFPFRYEDRTELSRIKDLKPDEWQTITGKVIGYDYFNVYSRRKVLKILVSDDTGHISLICYNRGFLKKILEVGMRVFISSNKFVYKYNEFQTADFDYEILGDNESDNENIHTNRIVPVYHSTENLPNKFIRTLIFKELKKIIGDIDDPIDNTIKEKYNLKEYNLCLYKMHFPANMKEQEVVRRRLAFDKFFFLEIVLALNKRNFLEKEKTQKYLSDDLSLKFINSLSFKLTSDQNKSLNEIITDMKSRSSMNRLLMGDVGSGKTIVALISALIPIENKYQTAFMAPTEILANQHYVNIKKLLEGFNIKVDLLVGKQKAKERRDILKRIEEGKSDLIIGTHALIEDNVKFKDLGYIIIDEQHRFGVIQRAKMHLKGDTPDILVMTATPIPRTLSLTVYGDLDISVIKQMPPGRKPIKTKWYTDNKSDKVYEFLKMEMLKKRQIYVVYPLVKESEKMDLKDAESMYDNFSNVVFKDFKIGLIHGQMKKVEKEMIMNSFRKGDIDLLVSTTVIEVGVDVANASVMVIEHAERFGIAQLHQLRGRIGRGDIASTCVLITGYKLSLEAKKRMKALINYIDGFKLAEIDLSLRGPGEIMGTRQTGLPDLKPANLIEDTNILNNARDEAFKIIKEDPDLNKFPIIKQYLKDEEYCNLKLIQVS